VRGTLLTLLGQLAACTELPEPVYEFGSFRVPGQRHLPAVRDFFPDKAYVGCDLRMGPGVDEVQDLHALAIPDGSVGTALLFDTIEHVRAPWKAMEELHRVLKPGGIVVMTSVWYFPIHAYPDDYWRFTSSAFRTLFEGFETVSVAMCGIERLPHTVVGVASKGPLPPETAAAIDRCVQEWRIHGSRTWKESVLDLAPPLLLVHGYRWFLQAMDRIDRLFGRDVPPRHPHGS
jgi:SAM-dependent methyltransferase